MTWTQPLCQPCWDKERPHDTPWHVPPDDPQPEICCLCGHTTLSGIYAIYNPAAIPYPTTED